MIDNFRNFEAGPDPFGAMWRVEFRWIQNGIAIRHADTVDVKFFVSSGEVVEEKVVALSHPHLLALSERTGQPVTDAWCSRLAAAHLKDMIESGADFEKILVTPTLHQLERLTAPPAEPRP